MASLTHESEVKPELRRMSAVRSIIRSRKVAVPLVVLLALAAASMMAPVIAPNGPLASDLSMALKAPGSGALLGTDELGRDMLARILYGGRVSLGVAFLSVIGALTVGMPLGLLAGYARGRVDAMIMRVIDGLLAFPGIILAMALAATIGESVSTVVVVIVVVSMPTFTRLVRGLVMQAGSLGYVEASRSLGTSNISIAVSQIFPNIVGPVIVQSTLTAANALLLEASLSFIGVGIPLPTPSWGAMVRTGATYLEIAPWLVLVPGIFIFVAVLALNLLGDGLRDSLDSQDVS